MLVKELMEALSKEDPEAEVLIEEPVERYFNYETRRVEIRHKTIYTSGQWIDRGYFELDPEKVIIGQFWMEHWKESKAKTHLPKAICLNMSM